MCWSWSTNLYKWLLSSWTSWNSGSIYKLTNSGIIRTKLHDILSCWTSSVINMIIFIFKKLTRRIIKDRLTHHARMSIRICETLIFRLITEIICWTSYKACLSASRSSSKHTGITFSYLVSKTFLWYNKTRIPGSI